MAAKQPAEVQVIVRGRTQCDDEGHRELLGSGQWAVGSGQWAVGSGQWAVGSGQWGLRAQDRMSSSESIGIGSGKEAGEQKISSLLHCPLPTAHCPLLLILLAGAVVRLALWAWFRDVPIHDDEKESHTLAPSLVPRGE